MTFNIIRKIVGGPKIRMTEDGYDLDLTYITPRIIAMAFPASGIQKIYRNSIDQVSQFIKQRHQTKYMIFNLSGRKYDYDKFDGKVKQYDWEDHQAPALYVLFEICQKIIAYMEQDLQNVVIVHCNHGKGRTGTIIICFMLFCNYFENVQEALQFYAKKRFKKQGYGVTQPCQIRYIKYFHQLLLHKKMQIIPRTLKKIQFINLKKNNIKFCVKLYNSRSRQSIMTSKYFKNGQILIQNKHLLLGDIFMQVIQKNLIGESQFARINFNTIFIGQQKESIIQFNVLKLKANEISPDSLLKKNKSIMDQDFQLIMTFQKYCQCHKNNKMIQNKCACNQYRINQQMYLEKIYLILTSYESPLKSKSIQLLYGKNSFKQN